MDKVRSDQYVFLKNILSVDRDIKIVSEKLFQWDGDINGEEHFPQDRIVRTLSSLADKLMAILKPLMDLKLDLSSGRLSNARSQLQKLLRNTPTVNNAVGDDTGLPEFHVYFDDPNPIDKSLFDDMAKLLIEAAKKDDIQEGDTLKNVVDKIYAVFSSLQKMKNDIIEAKLIELESQLSLSKEENPKICSVCLERPVDSVVYKCGHMCLCFECAQGLLINAENKHCPVCRVDITDIIKAYWS